jgi:ribonuclease P protein component
MVVPKRHAKRSVTRSLIRRQLREGLRRHVDALPPGDLVLRLRAPIDRQTYPSAASDALATLLRQEIETLLRDAVRRLNRPAASAAS